MPQDWLNKVPDASFLDKIPDATANTPVPKPSWLDEAKDLFTKPLREGGESIKDALLGKDTVKDPAGKEHKIAGPGMMEIPGVSKVADAIKNKAINTGSYPIGAAGSIASDMLKAGASGIDPRAAVIKELPNIPEVKPEVAPTIPDIKPEPKGLPPAPFVGGPSGASGQVAPTNTPLDLQAKLAGLAGDNKNSSVGSVANLDEIKEAQRLKSLGYTQAEQYPGTRLSIPDKVEDLPLQSGDTRGGFDKQTNSTLKYPLSITPNSLRPRAAQSDILGTTSLKGNLYRDILAGSGRDSGSDINFISGGKQSNPIIDLNKPDYYVGDPNAEAQLPSAALKPSKIQDIPEPRDLTTSQGSTGEAIPQVKTNDTATSNSTSIDAKSVKDAVSRWANKLTGATYRGNLAKETFADLTDPSLVDKYEAGDRSGRLADVEKFLNEKLAKGREAGIFGEEQARPNYLRHEYNESPDQVNEAVKTYVAKNPSIAKTGKFPTYSAAEESGLTRKYNTIPEILDSYTSRFHRAQANKEFYDYLNKTGQISGGDVIKSPDNWTFKGDNKDNLAKWVGNYLDSNTRRPFKKLADISSNAKNLAMGAGVPGTPLNVHGWNTARSDIAARGIKAGLGDFVQGIFNPKRDVQTIKDNGELIGNLIDHGMGWSNIEDHAALGSGGENATSNLLGKGIGKTVMNAQSKIFEDPLFKVHLPAIKLRLAKEQYDKYLPSLGEDKALDKAASIANDFEGGINKNLRNKTVGDALRIGVFAPDWLESRAKLAYKGVKALAGKEDPIYAKAMGRNLAMRAAGMGATAAITGSAFNPSNRGSNSSSIPLGQTSTGKNRELPIYGSAAEGLRIPENAIADIKSGHSEELNNMAKSRISIPAKIFDNVVLNNQDDFGDPLHGNDKYGRPISTGKAAGNIASQLAEPILPPQVIALMDLLNGKDPEASISKGVQSPLNYNSEERDSFKYPKGAPRFRINR